MMIDPYSVLGVPSTATQAEITHAYRRQLRDHHPDLRPGGSPSGAERLRQILAAYALLRDPRRRTAYDRHRHEATGPTRITLTRNESDRPPLRVGPVRRHR